MILVDTNQIRQWYAILNINAEKKSQYVAWCMAWCYVLYILNLQIFSDIFDNVFQGSFSGIGGIPIVALALV